MTVMMTVVIVLGTASIQDAAAQASSSSGRAVKTVDVDPTQFAPLDPISPHPAGTAPTKSGAVRFRSNVSDEVGFWSGYAPGLLFGLVGVVVALAVTVRHILNLNLTLRKEIAASEQRQRQLDRVHQRMAHVERMKSLGQLAGGVAHDLNNLLTSMICDAETLLIDTPDGRDTELRSIIRAAESAADLSRMMLTYCGHGRVSKSVSDLNSIVENSMKAASKLVRPSTQFTFKPAKRNVHAKVDPKAIEQILSNLISNASEAIDGAGEIVVAIGRAQVDSAQFDSDLFGHRTTGGDFVFFEVQDNGCGIPEAARQKVFEPFFTSRQHGRGLGLSVVYGHVNRHDGLIRMRTNSNGTCVRILLPLATIEPEPNRDGTQALETVRGEPEIAGTRVLVVDDESDVLNSIERLLTIKQCHVECARDGREAIDRLGAGTIDFDLVITDLVMPTCNGHTLISWMKYQASDLPVVVMSGYSDRDLRQYDQMPNVASVIEKPFTPHTLYQAVECAIGKPMTPFS